MSLRDTTKDDLDLEALIDLFDTALTSNNPAMKKAIKNLLLVATLIDSEISPEQRVRGPLRQALDDMRNLSRRMDRIEQEQTQRGMWQVPLNPTPMPGTPYTPGPTVLPGTQYTPGPTWIGTGVGIAPNNITYKTTSAVSTTAFDDQFRAEDLLTKLEAK